MPVGRRKRVRDILLEKKLVPEEKLKKLEEEAARNGKPLQQLVVEAKAVAKSDLLKVLSQTWGVKAVDLAAMEVDPEVAQMIPEPAARRYLAIPFAKEEDVLMVAMADPGDLYATEDIQLRTGLQVEPLLAYPEDILKELDRIYGVAAAGPQVDELLKDIEQKPSAAEQAEEGALEKMEKVDVAEVDASAPDVEKIVNAVILTALKEKASDIHIEPFEDPMGRTSRVVVRYRIDGMLREAPFQIPWSFRNAVIAKIKIMTETMNITERRIPQSGRVQVLAKGNPIEFRVEIVPTVYGESCVMRILDRKAVQVDIRKLGFLPDTLDSFLELLKGIGGKKNFGLILVCGPTGSGKSTTLYAALNYVNRPDIKILTAENPVEYNLDGIVQVMVNPDLKLGEDKTFDFAVALRSFLRLDPDVIMVGEIRDRETAQIAMEAAMTGHLVFSTIHTNDAPSTIPRLTEMGTPSFLVASTVKAVLAQRLVRRVCLDCKQQRDFRPEEMEIFKQHGVQIPSGAKAAYGKGCNACKQTGFKGRAGIHELLVMNDSLRMLALKETPSEVLYKEAVKQGMRTLIQDGLFKVLEGLTTVREVLGGQEVQQ